MKRYSLTHLGDGELDGRLKAVVARDHASAADVIAHIAEFDERRLHVPAAYPCMKEYCIRELHFSEDAASKRVYAARSARQFPAIFEALAAGRLHLSGIVTLASRLTRENADELIAAATHKTRAEIQRLLAERFPKPDLPDQLGPIPSAPPLAPASGPHAPGHVGGNGTLHAPGHAESPRARVTPLSADRSALQCTIPRRLEDKLGYARALASHPLPSGDLATLLEWCVDAFIEQQEKRRFAATARPGSGGRRGASARHIPAAVKRAVFERDRGQCTFVSDAGKRCPAVGKLEYDHEEPVARGGEATVVNLRLRCRVHNQFAAECAFGKGFMDHKRQEARARKTQAPHAPGHMDLQPPASPEPAAQDAPGHVDRQPPANPEPSAQHAPGHVERQPPARTEPYAQHAPGHVDRQPAARPEPAAQHAPGHVDDRAAAETDDRDVVPWLRRLGARPADARRAAELCESIPDASLEERVRFALKHLLPPHRRIPASPTIAT